MITTNERIEGYYEVRKTPFASDYVWVEGEEVVEGRLVEEILHPWRATYAEWVKEDRAHPEVQEWMELQAIDGANEVKEGGVER